MEIEQLEALALAEDREKALASLIPGTEDYYFHHCLHRQIEGRLDEVPALLEQWIQRHGRTQRAQEIERRQALLGDPSDPKTVEYLESWLSFEWDHQPEVEVEPSRHPSALDQAAISRAALLARAKERNQSDLSHFEDSALRWLGDELSKSQRQHFLDRIARPDHPRLVAWVIEDLDNPRTGAFGTRRVHALMLKAQLEDLMRARPALMEQPAFVFAYLGKLAPSPDVDAQHDLVEREQWLDRLWSFVKGLEPSFNAVKVAVLYHRLALDRSRSVFDRSRFLAYLRLPRQVHYLAADFLRAHQKEVVPLGTDFSSQLGLPAFWDDEPLVRAFVEHFLLIEPSIEDFAAFVRKDLLLRWRAFAMIAAGLGDQERWYAELDDPSAYQAYRDRVDVELAPENRVWFRADEPVHLALYLKNVRDLVVKVFEINTKNYFLANGREVDTSIDLDGLEAGEERTVRFDRSPLLIVRHELELPSLSKPGVYVVELIGNGKSSRALIKKGALRLLERFGAAGHVFTVLDEENRPLSGASLWLGGTEHRADADGEIAIPYSTRPEQKKLLISHGELTTVESFYHRAEQYRLTAGFYVDREQLLRDAKATLMVRAALFLGSVEVGLELLEEVRLSIASVDGQGTRSTLEIPGFELFRDRESSHRFQVPEELRSLEIALFAKVKSISEGRRIDLEAREHFAINGIDATDRTHDLHLAKAESGYLLYSYGKTGEPLAHQAINVVLKHRDFVEQIDVEMQTDARGRIALGPLEEIARVEAHSPAGVHERWPLERDGVSLPSNVHACTGESIKLPYLDRGYSLLERRSGSFQKDCTKQAKVERGQLVIDGLAAGDYDLFLDLAAAGGGARVTLRVTEGRYEHGWAVSAKRQLEARPRAKLAIDRIAVSKDEVEIRLAAYSEQTRVHLFATRFVPAYSPFEAMARVRDPEPRAVEVSKALSSYVSGRDIGDEYRYLLERKYRKKFPGNMLARPGLLLNPWAVRQTESGVMTAAQGAAYGGSAERRMRAEQAARPPAPEPQHTEGGFANLDFLAAPSVVQVNLRPDDMGVVRVQRSALGDVSLVRVVAVDRGVTIETEASLPEAAHQARDLRLLRPLDPKRHFTQKRQRSPLAEGGKLTIEDLATSELENIDTLRKAHGVLAALTSDPSLAEFSFALDWPSLDETTKRKKYSEYACHELNLFLERKDPAFFLGVVKPYLAHKKDRTFLDHYLLGDELSGYLSPWSYGRLNTLERILLGRRLDGEAGPARRHVKDRFDLLERNVEEEERLFQSMLAKSALDGTDSLGFEQAKGMAMASLDRGGAPGAASMAMPAAAPPARSAAAKMKKRARAMDKEEKAEEGESYDDESPADALSEIAELDLSAATGRKDLERDNARRSESRPLFRQQSKTEEWAENNYWHRRIHEQDASLIPVNGFWRDFAEYDGKGPFLSARFAEATSCFAEMMCALAVLDLPFAAGAHEVKYEGARMELTARSNAIVLSREIEPAVIAEKRAPILVSQNYYRKDDPHDYEDGERREKYVTGEMLVQVAYVCQVVLTNPTAARAKLDLLMQIPAGSMPLEGGFFTKGRPLVLEPYSTESIEYSFYFPSPSEAAGFAHYPAQVAKNEELVAAVPPSAPLSVVTEPTTVDTRSWAWVSQRGSTDEVLRYLDQHNVERLDLSRIAWRMRSRDAFEKVTALLVRRHRYDEVIWAYGHYHRKSKRSGLDPLITERMREHLLHQESFLRGCGLALEADLVTIDPVARAWYEHLEYLPLVNARAHRLGGTLKILNPALDQQYRAFLDLLCHRRASSADLLAASYYLFLQDRVEEGLACLERVRPSQVPSELQLDYLTAYAALYRDDLPRARAIAEAHRDHPVDRWRKRFEGVLAVLDEAADEKMRVVDVEDRGQEHAKLASTEPALEFTLEGKQIAIGYRNLDACTINYYGMDIELLFSRQPFVQQDSGRFSMIRPGRSDRIELPADRRELRVPLPDALAKKNVIVEVVAAGQKKAIASYAHELSVQVAEQYGHLYVRRQGTHAALPESYVKVYAKTHDGRVKFFKDGYADVRGCFDYASLSTDELDGVEQFSILILTERYGAVIREARPPQR